MRLSWQETAAPCLGGRTKGCRELGEFDAQQGTQQQGRWPSCLGQPWSFSQTQGLVTALPGQGRAAGRSPQGKGSSIVGAGKQETRKQESLCVCACGPTQHVSQLVPHQRQECRSRAGAPAPLSSTAVAPVIHAPVQ